MFFWLLQATLASLVVSAVFLRNVWPFDIIAGALGQLILVCLLAAVGLLFLGRFGGASILILASVIALWRVAPGYEASGPEFSDPDYKVVWANLFGRKQSLKSVLNLAVQDGASLIALAEFPENPEFPTGFDEAFPYRFPQSTDNNHDTVIFSRFPFIDTRLLPFARRPVLIVETEIDGRSITVGAVHAPVPWTPEKSSRQSKVIAAAFKELEMRQPSLLVGDFNATLWNSALAEAYAHSDSLIRVAIGIRATWISKAPLIGAPIDHAFVSRDIRATARVGPANGSDHFPLIISLKQ